MALKTYTISSADKAAFLNRLKKQKIQIGSTDIVDNTLNNTFTLDVNNPAYVPIIDAILKQSTSIDDNPKKSLNPIKSSPKLDELKKMIRKELSEVLLKRTK